MTVRRSVLEGRLTERIDLGTEIEGRHLPSDDVLAKAWDDYKTWDDYNATLLRRSFTTSDEADKYEASSGPIAISMDRSWAQEVSFLTRAVHTRLQRLVSLRGRLDLFDEPGAEPGGGASADTGDLVKATEIFIVHGRDGAAKAEVARFIQQVTSRTPVILHEQADRGRTVIEKFEEEAGRVAFAVVLLTADDIGGLADGVSAPRARQNVIFEMGFFVGAIGRSKVAVIYEAGVELPSDIEGILYTRLDEGGAWRMALGRELRSAGIEVDLNQAL